MFDVEIRGGTLGEFGRFTVTTQVNENELKGFLSLLLKGEEQMTVEGAYSHCERVYYYVIMMGTYGENFRGTISVKTADREKYLRVGDDVMSFHNRPLYGWENE